MNNRISQERINNALVAADKALSLGEQVSKKLGSSEVSVVNYKDFKSLIEGRWYTVNPGIKYMPIDLMSDILHFRTIIDNTLEDWEFGWQVHDCFELCKTRKGVLISGDSNKIATVNQSIIFDPYEPHNPRGGSEMITNADVFFSLKPFNDIP